MTTNELENTILRAIGRVRRDDWVPKILGELRNAVGEVHSAATQPSARELVDAVIALGKHEFLSIRKWDDAQRSFVQFQFAQAADGAYLAQFFYISEFQLQLTHEGRRALDEIEKFTLPMARKEPIGFN